MVSEYDDLGIATIRIHELLSIIHSLEAHFESDCLMCGLVEKCDGKNPNCHIYKDRQSLMEKLGRAEKPEEKKEEPKIPEYRCPECNSPVVFQEGCKHCMNCGWSVCL
jgi:hypothetical protein